MSPDLASRMIARHPVLPAMPLDTAIGDRGIECGDGWYDLIDETLTAIETPCAACGSNLPAITQIKEKFGLRRVYFRPWDDAIRPILDAAEQKSATCCEKCGRSGKIISRPSLSGTCGGDHNDGRGWRT